MGAAGAGAAGAAAAAASSSVPPGAYYSGGPTGPMSTPTPPPVPDWKQSNLYSLFLHPGETWIMHHTDSNRRIRGNLLLPVNSLLVDIYCFLCCIVLCMKGGRRLQAGYLCVAVGKKPPLATSSYHLELIILHLFCNSGFPQTRRAIVISPRVLCPQIQQYQMVWLLLRSLFVTLHEETSPVAVHLHVTVWRTLFSVHAVKHRG